MMAGPNKKAPQGTNDFEDPIVANKKRPEDNFNIPNKVQKPSVGFEVPVFRKGKEDNVQSVGDDAQL
jgi:hypothetical protein